MVLLKGIKLLLLLSFFSLLTACGMETTIKLDSDAGDYIGAGQKYEYSNADAIITVNATDGLLTVDVKGDESWQASFQLPDTSVELELGTYDNLERYPFHNPTVGGLSWTGEGRSCNASLGSVVIDKVTYVEGDLTEIEMKFEQQCGISTAALHGEIKWYSEDATSPPGPETEVPDDLWEPAADLLPEFDNYVYLESEAGDYIGVGDDYLYTEFADIITVSATENSIEVLVGGWRGTFKGMNSIDKIEPGFYAGLQRYPFNNPTKGGLSWSGNGRGCNTSNGWFVIDNVVYTGDNLSSVDLRFEQHCGGQEAALNGKIHWSE